MADLDPIEVMTHGTTYHIHGTGMSEAWNDPRCPPRPDRGDDDVDHMIIRDDSCDEPGAVQYRRKWPDPLRRAERKLARHPLGNGSRRQRPMRILPSCPRSTRLCRQLSRCFCCPIRRREQCRFQRRSCRRSPDSRRLRSAPRVVRAPCVCLRRRVCRLCKSSRAGLRAGRPRESRRVGSVVYS